MKAAAIAAILILTTAMIMMMRIFFCGEGLFLLLYAAVTNVSPTGQKKSQIGSFPNFPTDPRPSILRLSIAIFSESNFAFLYHLTSIFFFLPISHEHTFEHELFMDTFHTLEISTRGTFRRRKSLFSPYQNRKRPSNQCFPQQRHRSDRIRLPSGSIFRNQRKITRKSKHSFLPI